MENDWDACLILGRETNLPHLSLLPKFRESLVDKFYKEVNHGSQHQDDESSTGPIRSYTGSRDSKNTIQVQSEARILLPDQSEATLEVTTTGAVTVQRSDVKPLKRTTKKKIPIVIMTSTSLLQIIKINQSINQAPDHRKTGATAFLRSKILIVILMLMRLKKGN